jgi:tRNA-dihydrouridine synthase 3
MVGRGALIKPWIFNEFKTGQLYDISSSGIFIWLTLERFDMLKNFANYGLEHWGTDTQGVNQTRRFLCEWSSFLYRYVPVGIIETLPQRLNARPDHFIGRDDLETLMSSNLSEDWVKLSEMVLGPAPESFKFVPKHKSNSYETQG